MPHGQDTVRTTDGFQCSQAVAPRAYIDGGVYSRLRDTGADDNDDYGVYFRFVVPLGEQGERVNCKELYDFEMRYRQQMKAIEGLKNEIFD